jgi:ABC-2 type transport system ATP-binding protein
MSEAAISIRELHKTYRNGHQALTGLDLDVPRGTFFGLLGPNGAGKTTLIGLLSGLVRLEEGQIKVLGHDIVRAPVAAKRSLGLVPQEVNFNSFEPVEEIIEHQGMYYGLSPWRARQRARETLKRVELDGRIGQSAWGLSGGMKRRLMLARALVHQPSMLILDEPTAGVDVRARHDTWALLRELNAEGTTIVLTTHYLEEAEALCDELAIIDQGGIIARDTPRALLEGLDAQHLVLELETSPASTPELSRGRIRNQGERTLEVDWPRGEPFHALLDELAHQDIAVLGMSNGSNRLESRFLELVSQRGTGGGHP